MALGTKDFFCSYKRKQQKQMKDPDLTYPPLRHLGNDRENNLENSSLERSKAKRRKGVSTFELKGKPMDGETA